VNWDERPHRGRLLGLLAGVFGGPPVATAAYLLSARWVVPAGSWEAGLLAAALVGVVAGLACVARLPEPVAVRIALAVLYVPAAFGGLIVLSVLADGLVYGNWPGSP
jgi:hypothetical protein